MSWNTLSIGLGILILPIAVSQLAPHNTITEVILFFQIFYFQWANLFFGMAILVSLVTFIFNYTAEVEPRPWSHTKPIKRFCSNCSSMFDKNKIYSYENESKKSEIV